MVRRVPGGHHLAMTKSVYTPETTKKLPRSTSDKKLTRGCGGWAPHPRIDPRVLPLGLVAPPMLTGVCGGWATYLGIDASVLRIGMVAAVFLSVGIAIPVYVAAAILTPEEGS